MSETFLVVGEAVIDVVFRDGAAIETPGGSPLNVALGIGRLGGDVLLATRVGRDARGEQICRFTTSNGVALIDAARGLDRTSTATATIALDGSAAYEIEAVWDIESTMIPQRPFVHVHMGSFGATLEPGAQAVYSLAHKYKTEGATISFDPNIRPDIMGNGVNLINKIERLIPLSNIVKASLDDISLLYPGRSADDVARFWLDAGANIVIVTRGSEGVLARTSSHRIELSSQAVVARDTIGAGDSFMAGFLVALEGEGLLGMDGTGLEALSKGALEDCLRIAQFCAAFTVSNDGNSSPTREQLDNWIT